MKRYMLLLVLMVSLFPIVLAETAVRMNLYDDFLYTNTTYGNGNWIRATDVNYDGSINMSGFNYSTIANVSNEASMLMNWELTKNISWASPWQIDVKAKLTKLDNLNSVQIILLNNNTATKPASTFMGFTFLENYYTNGSHYVRHLPAGLCTAWNTTPIPMGGNMVDKWALINYTWNGTHSAIYFNGSLMQRTNWTCSNISNLSISITPRYWYEKVDTISVYRLWNYTEYVTITATAPTNNSHWNSPNNITMLMQSSEDSLNCTLYINSTRNDSKMVLNNTPTNFSISRSDGNYSYYFICNDSGLTNTSPSYNIILDNTFPVISHNIPLTDNSTIFDNQVTLIGSVSDNNLWRINVSIYNTTGGYLYTDYRDSLTPPTAIYSNNSINSTLWPDGLYYLRIEGSDSHTAEIFTESDIPIYKTDTESIITLKSDTLVFSYALGSEFLFTPEKDRIIYSIQNEKLGTASFYLDSVSRFKKVKDSAYQCHYVMGDYWFDADGLKNAVCALENNDTRLKVTYTQDEKIVAGRSIGGLNIVTATYAFNITHCVSAWVCDGIGVCRLNNTAPCGSVYDNNLCGNPYLGNYTEFGDYSCDYCTQSFMNVSNMVCIANVRNYTIQDVNFNTCCNMTNLTSDCTYMGFSELPLGVISTLQNCEMPPTIIEFGSGVMLMLVILIAVILLYIGVAFSMPIFVLVSGLMFFTSAGFIAESPFIKILLGMIGFVIVMAFAMMEYDRF